MNAILFKFFWFKVFVHWKLKLLNFPMHYDALTFLRLLWKFSIMNQTFYNLVEINRYERDLASRQSGIRECCFFWTEILAKSQGKKKQFESSLPFPVEWEWNGMREETGNELRHYIMNQSEAHNRSYPESKIIVVLVKCQICVLSSCVQVFNS